MMKILLVSATKSEVFSLATKLLKVRGNSSLWSCRLAKNTVDVLITGVGMTATAFYLGKQLTKKYDLAINVGVAGSYRRKIALGTVVNVVSDLFSDLGAEDGDKFLTLEELGLVRSLKFGVSGLKLVSPWINKLPKVNGITVNTVHGNPRSIKKVGRRFHPDVESMEGAAFFFGCKQYNIPAVQIRAISNYVERRNKRNWELDLAVKNLTSYIEGLLRNI
jgi:futalosine hydrolase